ncbi:MAG: transposase [Bifidobacteriaceae bacterium]|jgi:hypothetical protein|nr:transposase [Bifidobacteriaceae bacterium]
MPSTSSPEAARLVTSFMRRSGVAGPLRAGLTPSQRSAGYGEVLEAVVANLACGREPLYALAAWAGENQVAAGLDDDRVGRALEALWDADPAAALASAAVAAGRRLGVGLGEVHNDSTSLRLWGRFRDLDGRGGAVEAARGHSKDRRGDLKQLVAVCSVSADGAVPLAFRLAGGATEDSTTHVESFDQLAALLGTKRFTYVADSKLATKGNMGHIASEGGTFVTVLPRTRKECALLDASLLADPAFYAAAPVARTVPSRARPGSVEEFRAVDAPFRTAEGYRLVAVFHTAGARARAEARDGRIARAVASLRDLGRRAAAPRTKIRTREAFDAAARAAVRGASRWIRLGGSQELAHVKRVWDRPGRPGPASTWHEVSRPYWRASWTADAAAVAADAAADGWFPLVTNSPDMPAAEVLAVYKRQPHIEKRFHQLKGCEVGADPLRVRKPERVGAMGACWHAALLVCALMEHLVAAAMDSAGLDSLPIYPEGRPCRNPTARQILRAVGRGGWAADFIVATLVGGGRRPERLAA